MLHSLCTLLFCVLGCKHQNAHNLQNKKEKKKKEKSQTDIYTLHIVMGMLQILPNYIVYYH